MIAYLRSTLFVPLQRLISLSGIVVSSPLELIASISLDQTSKLMFIGSSRGRGTRAAGWFDDLIKARGDTNMKSVILSEGINGWAQAGAEYIPEIVGFDQQFWDKKRTG